MEPYSIEIYHRTHYNVNLQGISVAGATLQLPSSTFDSGDSKGTIIDSGTTLAYLPKEVYRTLLTAVWELTVPMKKTNSFYNIDTVPKKYCFLTHGFYE